MKYRSKLVFKFIFASIFLFVPNYTTATTAVSLTPPTSINIESNNLDQSLKQIKHHDAIDNNSIANNRHQYFSDGNIIAYIKSLFQPYFHYSKLSYIAALLIFLLYLFYFRYIDIYEYEPWKYIILIFFAGILFADIGLILYDFTYIVLGWHLNNKLFNDLFYTIFVIGGIEEFVKIIPLLLLLRFTKIINEPIDYIVYAGVAALGFAFSENVMYFDRMGAGIIFGRALTAVVLHTSLSSIVAYGFVLRKYRQKKTAPLKMFFIAMVLHGLYDLFLINPVAQKLMLIAYLILFAGIIIFNGIVSNSLSNSPYYNKGIHIEVRKIQFLLIGGLSGIFVIQYLMLVASESFSAANDSIWPSALIAVFLIPALVVGFGKIEIHPKKWKSIKLPLLFTKITIDDEKDDIVNSFLKFTPMTRNRIMHDYFPNMGKVYKQSMDSKNQLWFYIRLDRLGHHPYYNNKHIVIRSKFGNKLLNDNEGLGMAGIYLIKTKTNKPIFVGWCSVEQTS